MLKRVSRSRIEDDRFRQSYALFGSAGWRQKTWAPPDEIAVLAAEAISRIVCNQFQAKGPNRLADAHLRVSHLAFKDKVDK